MPTHDSSPYSQSTEKYLPLVIVILGGAFIVGTLAAGLFPSYLNWGLHQPGFLPTFWTVCAIALMALFCVPFVQVRILESIDVAGVAWVKYPRPVRRSIFIVSLIIAGSVFWILKEALPLYGDGSWLIRQVPLITDVSRLPGDFTNEPFVGFIAWNLYKLLHSLDVSPGSGLAFQLLSIGSGVGVIVFLAILAQDLFAAAVDRWLFQSFVFVSGGCQLFFGNIENYAFPYLVLVVLIVYGVRYVHGKSTLMVASGVFGVLFASYFGAIVFLPAVAWLYFREIRRGRIRHAVISLVVTVGLSATLLFLSGYTLEGFIGVMAFSPFHRLSLTAIQNGWQGYTLLSWKHFLELGNLFLVLSPFAPVFLILIVRPGFRRTALKNATWVFLTLLALGGGFMLLVFSPALGMSRDWITLAIYPVGIIIASAYGVLHFLEPALLRRRILLLAAGITFASTMGWIVLNSDADAALARFKVLPNGTTWGVNTQASAYEQLAILYRNRMDATNAIFYYRKYLEVDPLNGRIWSGLANVYRLIGDTDNQMACNEEAISHGVPYVDVYIETGLLYASRHRFEDAIAVTRKGVVQDPQSVVAHYNLGTFILQRDSNAYREAVQHFARAADINPSYANAFYNAGICWYHLKNYDACIPYLQRYLQLAPDPQRAAAVEALLRSIQKPE